MKTKTLKNLVNKARGEFVWAVREVAMESGPVQIFSDPMNKSHTIYLPTPPPENNPKHELVYLHALGHALLCERIHPFFASGFPIAGLEKEQLLAVGPMLSTASDWFVGHWLMEFCPELATAELHDEYEATAEMMARGETPNLDRFFVAVLIAAQSIKYLKTPINCSGFLEASVQTFLAVSPDTPSVEKLITLINGLLALGAPYRCRLMNNQGQDVLEFLRSDAEQVISPAET